MPLLKSIAAWFLILLFAMLNGFFRESVLLPALGTPHAYIVSGVLLAVCILTVAIALARWMELGAPRRAVVVGVLWLSLTLVFEFGFGGLVQGKSWAQMLEAYTFKDGNIWPVVMVVTLLAPVIAAKVRVR